MLKKTPKYLTLKASSFKSEKEKKRHKLRKTMLNSE